jgi:hypothetical protein
MNQRFYKMLMNQEGSSPGGGAPPAPAQAPATAAGAASPPSVPLDQVKGLIAEAVTAAKNEMAANFRRAGGSTKDEKPPGDGGSGAPAAAAPSGFIAQADVERMLARDRVVTRVATANNLSDAQVTRMERALKAENPDDIAGWTKTYLEDFGLLKNGANPSQATTQIDPKMLSGPQQPPISDKGAPAPGNVGDFERETVENPIGIATATFERLAAKHGEEKARTMLMDAARAKAANIKVTVK